MYTWYPDPKYLLSISDMTVIRETLPRGEVVLSSVYRKVQSVPIAGVCYHKELETPLGWFFLHVLPHSMSFGSHHTLIHSNGPAGMIECLADILYGVHEGFESEQFVMC